MKLFVVIKKDYETGDIENVQVVVNPTIEPESKSNWSECQEVWTFNMNTIINPLPEEGA